MNPSTFETRPPLFEEEHPSANGLESLRRTTYANLQEALRESGARAIRLEDDNADAILRDIAALNDSGRPDRLVLRAKKGSEIARKLHALRIVHGMKLRAIPRDPEIPASERDPEELRLRGSDPKPWRLGAGGFTAMEDALLNTQRALRSGERTDGLRLKVTDTTLHTMTDVELVRLRGLLDAHRRSIQEEAYEDIRRRLIALAADRRLRAIANARMRKTAPAPTSPPARQHWFRRAVNLVANRFRSTAKPATHPARVRIGVQAMDRNGEPRIFNSVAAVKRYQSRPVMR